MEIERDHARRQWGIIGEPGEVGAYDDHDKPLERIWLTQKAVAVLIQSLSEETLTWLQRLKLPASP